MSPNAKRLNERAMLVDLSISLWYARRKDKQTSSEAISTKAAESDSGAWWTRVISRNELKAIIAAQLKGRMLHYKLTLPWNDDGTRILPADMFMDYTKQIRAVRDEFDAAVDAFVARYPDLVARAQARLGNLYHAEFFPPAHKLRSKFDWQIKIFPLPDAGDFRVDLGHDQTKAIQTDIEQAMNERMAVAMKELWTRLHDAVAHMADRLANAKNVFRDSMVKNVAEMCDLLGRMNITNDPALEEMRQAVASKLAKQKPDALRSDDKIRKSTHKAAKDILSKLDEFLGGKKG